MYCPYFRLERQDKGGNWKRNKNKDNIGRQYDPHNGKFRKYEERKRFFEQFDNGNASGQSILTIEIRFSEVELKILKFDDV